MAALDEASVDALRQRVRTSPYASCYCEENVYRLVDALRHGPHPAYAVFISSRSKFCPVWCQRSARAADEPVMWDYHVVAAVFLPSGAYVCDFDTRLGAVTDALAYVDAALGPAARAPFEYRPRVRVVAAATLVDHFASDRRHMRDDDGTYQAPPPAWAPVRGPAAAAAWNLDSFADTTTPRRHRGAAMDVASFRSWLARTPGRVPSFFQATDVTA